MNSNQEAPDQVTLVPALRFSTELRFSNSRFIATIAPAFSVSDAKAFIREISDLYSDATHNVPVYLIGAGTSVIAHSSDNGEPSGTAGRPALSVLTGSGLGDTVLVITRYFGGTKLGTGGLVKAYSESARSVIQSVPKARKIIVHRCQLTIPYNVYEQAARIIRFSGSSIEAEEFAEQVTIRYLNPVDTYADLTDQLSDLTQGKFPVQIIAKDQTAIVPIK